MGLKSRDGGAESRWGCKCNSTNFGFCVETIIFVFHTENLTFMVGPKTKEDMHVMR